MAEHLSIIHLSRTATAFLIPIQITIAEDIATLIPTGISPMQFQSLFKIVNKLTGLYYSLLSLSLLSIHLH